MNIPRTLETAVATAIRQQAIGAQTVIRCWHVLRNDYRWNPATDRVMPCIDIRCAPPVPGEQVGTFAASISIIIATKTEDDKDHTQIAANEEGAQTAVDTLYGQSRKRSGAAWIAFASAFNSECAPAVLGGLTIGTPSEPSEADGINTVGINLTAHYSRPDLTN